MLVPLLAESRTAPTILVRGQFREKQAALDSYRANKCQESNALQLRVDWDIAPGRVGLDLFSILIVDTDEPAQLGVLPNISHS